MSKITLVRAREILDRAEIRPWRSRSGSKVGHGRARPFHPAPPPAFTRHWKCAMGTSRATAGRAFSERSSM